MAANERPADDEHPADDERWGNNERSGDDQHSWDDPAPGDPRSVDAPDFVGGARSADDAPVTDAPVTEDETVLLSDGRHAARPAGDPHATDQGPAGNERPIDTEHAGGQGDEPSAGAVGDGGQDRPAIDPPPAAPDPGRQHLSLPPGPALVAVGLGLLTKNGWVFQDINLTLRPASVAAIVGPAGSGRTSLLLALVGRMEANTGSLTIAGHSLQDRPRNIRMVTSVARAGRLTAPEPGLTVSESVSERCLIEDENVLAGRSRFEEACAALHLVVDPTMLVGRLAGEQATLLAVALACVRVTAVIVLDDLDRDVSAATQQRMVDALSRLAKAMGPTIIVSTTDRIPVMDADVVLDLTPMDGAAIWELDPRGSLTEVITRGNGDQPGLWAGELSAADSRWSAEDRADNGGDDQADADTPGADPDTPDADPDTPGSAGVEHHATDSDYDGRWSRERWEPPSDRDVDGRIDERGGSAPGDAANAPGPTEDPR